MTQIDKEIDEAMGAVGPWEGSSVQMWQKVEGEIRRRQNRGRWMRTWAPVAVAAAALVVALGVKPGINFLTPHPQGEIGGGPVVEAPQQPGPSIPEPPNAIKKLPDNEKREPNGALLSLPDYVGAFNTIVLGQVVSVQDISIPYVDSHTDHTPLPPDHPKAGHVTPPVDPFPAKLYTVKATRLYKGDPGQSFLVRQLVPSERVSHSDGKPDTLMTVGSSYLFFFHNQTDELLSDWLQLGADNRFMAMTHMSSVLKALVGLTPDEAASMIGGKQP